MPSPWDEVRRESVEIPIVRPARPSPLPWMLLTVSIALTIGVLVLGEHALEDERTRTANALKANDELRARLKALEAPLDGAREGTPDGELKKQVISLELEKRRLQDELSRARKK